MEFRVVDKDKREVAGIAVPYEQLSNGEMFARDSVTLDPEAKLMWQHDQREPEDLQGCYRTASGIGAQLPTVGAAPA
jgi:hypothetical protein